MNEDKFDETYPKDKFVRKRTSYKKKASNGQAEIESYHIIDKATGNVVLKTTRTEHTNLSGLDTTIEWDL